MDSLARCSNITDDTAKFLAEWVGSLINLKSLTIDFYEYLITMQKTID